MKYRNIQKDIYQCIEDVFDGDGGFFWGVIVRKPIEGKIYRVSLQKKKENENGIIYSFEIFDCRGILETEEELPSLVNLKVLSISGFRCLVELCDGSCAISTETTEYELLFYSSLGITILLDNFFDTGMLLAQNVWPNEKLPIDYLLRMPTDNFIRKDVFPIVPRIVSPQKCSFYMTCENCDGAGDVTCDKCYGSGKVKCRNCNGSGGHWTCDKCGGNGYLKCDRCDGYGKIDCKKCDGDGNYYSKGGYRYDCRACDGKGKWECRACGGDGEIKCFVCKGKGSGHCRVCDGVGSVQCPSCKGNCNIECWVCQETGRSFVYTDFRNKKFIRKYKEEETEIPISNVFLYDPETEESWPIDGFGGIIKEECLRRFHNSTIIKKRKEKLYSDGKSVLDCLQRKLDLNPADNEPPVRVQFSSEVPLERAKKHAVYELSIEGRYNWLKRKTAPWPENTPVCFVGIDFDSEKADDIVFYGIDFDKRTLKISISSKYDISLIKDGIQQLKSSAPTPPEKREIQYLKYWLDKDNDTVFDALAKGVNSEEYPISNWFNSCISNYPSQISAVKQGVSQSPILLLQGPPGTGKTTVIVEIILQAIAQNKRVLLTSQTHQAVCNVLEKLHKLKQEGKTSVSMVRYAKDEGKLSDIEKMYLAGYQEEELQNIRAQAETSRDNLAKKRKSLKENLEICVQAFKESSSIEQIKKQRDQALQNAMDDCQNHEIMIRELYAGRRESEKFSYTQNRSSLDKKLTAVKLVLTKIENEIQKSDSKIKMLSDRLSKRQNGSLADKIFNFTDRLKIFGVQSAQNIEEELRFQKQIFETNEQKRRDTTKEIWTIEKQIDACDNSYSATIKELKENEEKDIKVNFQERNTNINVIKNDASQKIEPFFEELTNAVVRLQNIHGQITASASSKEWSTLIEKITEEILLKDKEIDIKDEWLRDINASPEAIGRFLNSQVQVFMATCVGLGGWQALQNGTYERGSINTDSLVKTMFDLVIVDEAGHATFAETVIPMCFAKKVLLIGDDKQLPPILGDDLPCHKNMSVTCASGVNGMKCDCWFEYSLFSYLWQNKELELPHLMLDTQFRMHSDIGNFISSAFYDGKLHNGVKDKDRIFSFSPFTKPVCVVSTSSKKNRFDESAGTSYFNSLEVMLVKKTVKALVDDLNNRASQKEEGISLAIITPYAKQVELLRKELKEFFNCSSFLDFTIEDIASVDKFQGSEKDIIITTFVRSPKPCHACSGEIQNKQCRVCNGKGHKGGRLTFVQDLKRMNVAFSRAKKQLILIGDIEALCKFDGNAEGCDVLKQFYSYVQEKGRVLHVWESEEE